MPAAAGFTSKPPASSLAATLSSPSGATGKLGLVPAYAALTSPHAASHPSTPATRRTRAPALLRSGDADPRAVGRDRAAGAVRLAGVADAAPVQDQPVR